MRVNALFLSCLLLHIGCTPVTNDELPTDPVLVDADGDGVTVADGDCDDGDATQYPGSIEVCNGEDDDCDGAIDVEDDDISDANIYYVDDDGDGFGEAGTDIIACSLSTGYSDTDADCDDTNAAVYPEATERCNGIDDDCDTFIDDEDDNVIGAGSYYSDDDDDGYGNADSTTTACDLPEGYSENSTDCDDIDAGIFPGSEETCDNKDQDCDEAIDEGLNGDSDGDSFVACEGGFTIDCDDLENGIYPGAVERCDGVDDDCDLGIDEDFDGDGDGYTICQSEADCDDGDLSIHPGAEEVCDGIDNDCSGGTGDFRVDATGEGDYSSLQTALEMTSNGCVISVVSGTYVESVDFLGKAITLISEDGPETTIINVGPLGQLTPYPAFIFDSGEGLSSVVEGFTIKANNGETSKYDEFVIGGAIQLGQGVGPTLRGNIFSSGTADLGGAIACIGCVGALIEGNTFEDNTAYAYAAPFGNYIVGMGGAIYVESGEITLRNNLFRDNHADLLGGVIAATQGVVSSEGDVFLTNTAGWGGVFYGSEATLSMVGPEARMNRATGFSNSSTYNTAEGSVISAETASTIEVEGATFVDNIAQGGTSSGFGGAIVVFESDLALERSLIEGSSAISSGGAIYAGLSTLEIRNNLFVENTAMFGGALYIDGSDLIGFTNNGIIHSRSGNSENPSSSVQINATLGPINNNDISFEEVGYGFSYSPDSGNVEDPILLPFELFAHNNVYASVTADYGEDFGIQTNINGNISEDPKYIDPDNGDFHLGEGSLLINAGKADLSDVDGSVSDIGAFGGPKGDWTPATPPSAPL